MPHRGGRRVTGDDVGAIAVMEFPDHPFLVATPFPPERTSHAGAPHALVTA